MSNLMTLSEALATKRPFKHKAWGPNAWITEENIDKPCHLFDTDFFKPVWQVLPEEKPPMKIVRYRGSLKDYVGMLQVNCTGIFNEDWEDCTKDLAAALAPFLKREV